jgi:hypothetical protein
MGVDLKVAEAVDSVDLSAEEVLQQPGVLGNEMAPEPGKSSLAADLHHASFPSS